MSLKDKFGSSHPQEAIDKYGKRLLDEYGVEACEAAARLEEMNLDEGTLRSYKPQVRQIVAATEDVDPTPRDVVDHISNADKKSSTKSMMISAMKKYFNTIGEPEKAEEVGNIAEKEGVGEMDFSTEMDVEEWIKKEEVERIEEYILPDEGEIQNRLSGPDKEWIISLEHKALVMTLFYTASRVGEVCRRFSGDQALSVEDLERDTGQIEMYRLKKKGKGYKRDMKVVPDKLWEVLDDYMEQYDIQEGHIFPFTTRTAQNRITEIHNAYVYSFGEFSNMEKLTPHKFRHGRITDIANSSGLEKAGQYVDHSSSEITNSYRHLAAETQREILPEEQESEADKLEALMEKLGADSIDEALEKVSED